MLSFVSKLWLPLSGWVNQSPQFRVLASMGWFWLPLVSVLEAPSVFGIAFCPGFILEHTLFCAWKFLIWVFTFYAQPCICKVHPCLLLPLGPPSSVFTECSLPFPWPTSAPSVSISHPCPLWDLCEMRTLLKVTEALGVPASSEQRPRQRLQHPLALG